DEGPIEVGFPDGGFQLALTHRFRIFLPLPWLNLPAVLPVVSTGADQTLNRDVLPEHVWPLIFYDEWNFKAAAGNHFPRATKPLYGFDLLHAADGLDVLGHDFVRGLRPRTSGAQE